MGDENNGQDQKPTRDERKPGAAVATAVLAAALAVEPITLYVLEHDADPSHTSRLHTHQDPPPANRDQGKMEVMMGQVTTSAVAVPNIESIGGFVILKRPPSS